MVSFGSQKSESKPVQLGMYSPEQQETFSNLANVIQTGIGGNVNAYPKSMYVPRTPEEQQYFDIAGSLPGTADARISALNSVLSGKPAYEINPDISKQYFEKSIKPIMSREFYGTTLPAISEKFAGPGYWSSARALAETDATGRYAENLGAAEADLVYKDELARRQALESAATRSAGVALPSVEALVSDVGTAGEYARSIQQEQTLSDYQRWLAGETVEGVAPSQYNPFLQLAFQLLGQQPFTYGTQSSSSGSRFGILS